jgi:hypothetical protein
LLEWYNPFHEVFFCLFFCLQRWKKTIFTSHSRMTHDSDVFTTLLVFYDSYFCLFY